MDPVVLAALSLRGSRVFHLRAATAFQTPAPLRAREPAYFETQHQTPMPLPFHPAGALAADTHTPIACTGLEADSVEASMPPQAHQDLAPLALAVDLPAALQSFQIA